MGGPLESLRSVEKFPARGLQLREIITNLLHRVQPTDISKDDNNREEGESVRVTWRLTRDIIHVQDEMELDAIATATDFNNR